MYTNTILLESNENDVSISYLESEEPAVNVVEDPEYNDFAVVFDSGAADHVVDSAIIPGYGIQESFGSKVGLHSSTSPLLPARTPRTPPRL